MDNDYILHKYLNDEASLEEIQQLKASPNHASLIKISEASQGFEPPAHDSEANLLLILEHIDTRPKHSTNWVSKGLKIAAVLLAILASYIFINSLDTTISTEIAQQKVILLPNNSKVQLNANSTLSFNKNNWEGVRTISLEGEAFFKVTKGRTFEVLTPLGKITVLGTEFNVFARDNVFHIECFEGLVEVVLNNKRLQLPAGKKVQIENGVIALNGTTLETEPSWMTSESSFHNVSVKTVLGELENYYDVHLEWPAELEQRRFSGSFTHNDLEIALKSICTPLRLQFVRKGNQVTIYDQDSR